MLRDYAQSILSQLLLFFWLTITSTPFLLLTWLLESHPRIESTVSGLCAPFVLVWFFGSLWLWMTTHYHMFVEVHLFLGAVKSTLHDLRFKLAFVPLVGRWFTLDEDKNKKEEFDV